MSIKGIAKDLYRLQQAVAALEKKLASAPLKERPEIDAGCKKPKQNITNCAES